MSVQEVLRFVREHDHVVEASGHADGLPQVIGAISSWITGVLVP